jgi:hypothetical protein
VGFPIAKFHTQISKKDILIDRAGGEEITSRARRRTP